jgi:uncharacterized membrane protein YfhO
MDGVLTPHARANYVLRAMKIPAGKHKVEFKFEPASYFIRDKVSLVAGIILILGMIASIVYFIKKQKASEEIV